MRCPETYVPRGPTDVTLQQKHRQRIKDLEKALVRAVNKHGHEWGCSGGRGLDSECTCGWVEIKQMAKEIQPCP